MITLLVLLYFERYRGIATGVLFLGATLAALAFPQAAVYLEEKYGYRGTLLIFGGIALHVTAICLLLKALSSTRHQSNESGTNDSPDTRELRITHKTKTLSRKERFFNAFYLLRMPFFYALVVSSVLVDYSNGVYLTTVVDFEIDKGFSLADSETVISYATVGDIVGCLLLPSVADSKYLSRGVLNMTSFFLLGTAMFLQPVADSYGTFVTASGIIRLGIACSQTMRSVLVGDYFGAEWLTSFTALSGLASLPVLLLSPSIIGT